MSVYLHLFTTVNKKEVVIGTAFLRMRIGIDCARSHDQTPFLLAGDTLIPLMVWVKMVRVRER